MALDGVQNPIIPVTPRPGGTTAPTVGAPAEAAPQSAAGVAADSTSVGGGNRATGDLVMYQAAEVAKDLMPVMAPSPEVRQEFSHEIEAVQVPETTDAQKTPIPQTAPKDIEPTPQAKPPYKVVYANPPAPPPPPLERTIEVAGSGMGADKKFKMYPSELAAVYAELKASDGNMSLEDMRSHLLTDYGIDCDIKDGTLVNKENGHALIADTNGNGSLDMGDLNFDSALKDAGIDPASIGNPLDGVSTVSSVAYWANYWADEVNKEMQGSAGGDSNTDKPKEKTADAPKAGGSTATPRVAPVAPTNERLVDVPGGDHVFRMYPSELAAMDALLKRSGGSMTLEEMQKELKDGYGIDCDLKDGMLVNKANGHELCADTDGSGRLDLTDLEFDKTLQSIGIDPASLEPVKA